jgi:aminomethyltransferase
VDDLIVYLRGADEVLLVPNAANTAEVTRRLAAVAPEGVVVRDEHEEFAVLAVQGPLADEVLDAVNLPVGQPYMSFVDATWEGAPVTVCRTGYTGERGYEVLPPAELAPPLWDGLLERVRMLGGLPCGLGARDTLRTEMGYPLHGHELSLEITPVQARVGWAVGWSKPAFWGREVLQAERARGADRLLWGVLALERGVPRPGLPVVAAEGGEGSEGGEATGRLQAAERGGAGAVAGERVGVITSGTFSPTLRQGIGLALLGRSIAEGDEVVVDVRGRPLRCRVGRPPFVSSRPT